MGNLKQVFCIYTPVKDVMEAYRDIQANPDRYLNASFELITLPNSFQPWGIHENEFKGVFKYHC